MTIHEYLDKHRYVSFKWGHMDCFRFVDSWVRVSGGTPFIRDETPPYHDEKSAQKTYVRECKLAGVSGFRDLFDVLYDRSVGVPPDGSIVARVQKESSMGYVLGVVSGRSSFFLGTEGLESLPLSPETEEYWKIK